MREWIGGMVKKVTLETLYKLVDERTHWIVEKQEKDKQELLGHIRRIEEKQEKDKQELLGHVRRIEDRQEKFQDEVRTEFRHINHRIDMVMEMLLTIASSLRKEE
ncbi:MAG: hypothetical protein NZ560_01330 [Aquificaceae bacterium]|nr:hypothetical protein [Aquificaceae bacterium]